LFGLHALISALLVCAGVVGAGVPEPTPPRLPLDPGTWWVYREYSREPIGALWSTTEAVTRFEVRRTRGGGLLLLQTGGVDAASAPVEWGHDWVRLGVFTGEEPLPWPLAPGAAGSAPAEGLRGWSVEAEEGMSVPAGEFMTWRCAIRTRSAESVLWIDPAVGVVRETQGRPGEPAEIERVLVRWSGQGVKTPGATR
jgi:hypothetical protein